MKAVRARIKKYKSSRMGASFDNYVSERYDDWVAYAEALCLKYGVKLEAREVVNESFRVLLERKGPNSTD